MSKIVSTIVAALLVLCPLTGSAQDGMKADQWYEDLAYLASELPRWHVDAFHSISPETWQSEIRKVQQKIPVLRPHEVVVELMRVAAHIRDGHTKLDFRGSAAAGFRFYPVRFYEFKDGIFVIQVAQEYRLALGKRVVRIGDTDIESAYVKLRELVSRDNEMGVRDEVPYFMGVQEILHALGIISDMERGLFVLEDDAGETATVSFKPAPAGMRVSSGSLESEAGEDMISMLSAREDGQGRTPLFLQKLGGPYYWFEHLEDSKTVYFKFRRVDNNGDETLAQFTERLFAFINHNDVERLVIDIRLNGGGNNQLNQSFIHNILKNDKINQSGKLYVIIGRRTFSAAQHLVTQLELHTKAIFVGEPTGGRPNHYADAVRIYLPNSGLAIKASTLYWQNSLPWDDREWTSPDIAAEMSFSDYRSNLDPAMEAILNRDFQEPLGKQILKMIENNKMSRALATYHQAKDNPIYAYVDREAALIYVAITLIEQEKLEAALVICELNVREHPGSAEAHEILGQAHLHKGNKELAISSFEKALGINPNSRIAFYLLSLLEKQKH